MSRFRLKLFTPSASLGLALLLTGCSSITGLLPNHTHKTAASPLNIVSAGLIAQQSGPPELALTLANTAKQTLWVNVHFKTPDGANDCFMGKEMPAGSQKLLLCPQPSLRAATDYPIKISAYDSPTEEKTVSQLNTTLHFDQNDIQAAGG